MTINFTRWRRKKSNILVADILSPIFEVSANLDNRSVTVGDHVLSPDEARLYGVRLIEAAVLAAGDSTVREAPLT